MIHSMTGFGKATYSVGNQTISVSIKTLNGKQIDISARIPSCYREHELALRAMLTEQLVRGKVELTVSLDDVSSTTSPTAKINPDLYLAYARQLTELQGAHSLNFPVSSEAILRLPGVVELPKAGEETELTEGEAEALRHTTQAAIDQLQAFRAQEGRMLYDILAARVKQIRELLAEISEPEGERISLIRARLEEALARLSPGSYDTGRLEQEMIYYIEKLDINEEKARLAHHLGYFLEVLGQAQPGQGKTLGFIAQEIGREINTLGSKSNNPLMQQLVVRMKDELEQIKEQVLNVL